MKFQKRNMPYPRTNMPGAYLNAQSAARQIRLNRICTAEGWPVGRNPWMGGVTVKGRKPEITGYPAS